MNIKSKSTYYLILATFFLSMIFAQKLDPQDIAYNELREVVESASRANKKVWLEDFTGIN
tara:strand:+ start:388 stop:567 length:180 start_codon:yes stop_codon:yes gene_type:complete